MKADGQVFVGRYVIFESTFGLWLDPSVEDCSATWKWTPHGRLKIDIGILGKCWPQVVRGLLHELVEVGTVLRRCHFKPSNGLNPTPNDSYLIVMRHDEFSNVIDEAGDCVAYAIKDLELKWKAVCAKAKRKGKR